jgi:hypothetical protein
MKSSITITGALALFSTQAIFVHARPQYLQEIPNANNISFNKVDLGHAEGNLLRNPFGKDFDINANRKWTKELCEADSDSDGQTNGQELGDPCCIWTPGADDKLQWRTGMSNPGNKSSTSDKNLWKSVNCTEIRAALEKTSGVIVSYLSITATATVVISAILALA